MAPPIITDRCIFAQRKLLFSKPHSQLFAIVDIYNFANNLLSTYCVMISARHLSLEHVSRRTQDKDAGKCFLFQNLAIKTLEKIQQDRCEVTNDSPAAALQWS
jgi:hypothetical protein